MGLFGFLKQKKSSSSNVEKLKSTINGNFDSTCGGQFITPTQRLVDISGYLDLFKPRVVNHNLVSLYHEIVEIQHPVNLVIDRCLNAKITLKEYKTEAEVWSNDKINKFLEQPNPLYSFDELFKLLLCYYLVTGNSYLVSDIPGYSTKELWKYADNYYLLPSQNVDIKLVNNGYISPFTYKNAADVIKSYDLTYSGQRVSYSPDSVLHIKGTNILFDNNFLKGKTPLLGCTRPISNLIAQYEARNAIFIKRGALGALVVKDQDDSGTIPLSAKEKQTLRKEVDETYGVTGGRETLMIIDKPAEFLRLNLSIQELQPYDEYLSDTVAIAAALKVPRDLAISKDRSTYANQDGSEVALYENTAMPLTNAVLRDLTNWLGLRNSGLYLNADFSHIPCLQANKKEQASVLKMNTDSYSKLYDSNTITFNEMRVGLGYEAVEGMDKYKYEIVSSNGGKENS